jgi:hypothetical protein
MQWSYLQTRVQDGSGSDVAKNEHEKAMAVDAHHLFCAFLRNGPAQISAC